MNQQKSDALKELEYLESFLKEKSWMEINETGKTILGKVYTNLKNLKNTDEEFLIPRFIAVYHNLMNILRPKNSSIKNERRIYFLSFGDARLIRSLERIRRQAEEMDVFHEINCWTQDDIDRDFWERWKHKIPFDGLDYKSSGFFIWKPQIVMQVLEKMNDGDVLLYCDVGCHLHHYGGAREMFWGYVDLLCKNETGVLCFIQNNNLERTWTKGDIFDYFGCRDKQEIYNTRQAMSGVIFFRKCEKSMDFVKKWRQVYHDSFELHDSETFNSPNLEGFVANRCEQSTLSLLAKLNKVEFVEGAHTAEFPITAARDKEYTF